MALAPGTTLGPYEILAPLGAGGMGEVYRARDAKLARDVAIKVLPESVASDAKALARFEHEARAVAALSHPNILSIFDFGTHDGTTSAVTELLERETFRELLRRGPLSARRATELATQVAHGLAASVAVVLGLALALPLGFLAGRSGRPVPSAPPRFTQLTSTEHPVVRGRFTHDGRSIVYTEAGEGIRELSLGKALPRPVLGENVRILSVSATDQLAVALVDDQTGMGTPLAYDLYLRPTDGSFPTPVGRGVGGDISPDGRDVLVSRRGAGKGLFQVPAAGGKELKVPTGGLDSFSQLRWSRAGEAFVIARRGADPYRLWKGAPGMEPEAVGPPFPPYARLMERTDGRKGLIVEGKSDEEKRL